MSDCTTYRPEYEALHRPFNICGVDRGLFLLTLLLGAATFNFFNSEVLMTLRLLLVNSPSFVRAVIRRVWIVLVTLLLLSASGFAQSPWERAASNLEASFTGPLARSLALVAIVIGGLMFMFGEGGAKRQISGIVFGGGLCLFAVQFLAWLF